MNGPQSTAGSTEESCVGGDQQPDSPVHQNLGGFAHLQVLLLFFHIRTPNSRFSQTSDLRVIVTAEEMALASVGTYFLVWGLSVPGWCTGLRWTPDLTRGPRQKRERCTLFQRKTCG